LHEWLEGSIGRVVRRRQYDAALLDRVRDRGIAVRDGVAFRSMTRHHDGVRIETSAGELHARAVVGADGMGSAVRRSLGIPRGPYHAQAIEVDTPWDGGDMPSNTLHFDVCDRDNPGYAWDFPTVVDGRSMVCRGIYQLSRGVAGPNRRDIGRLLSERLSARGIIADRPFKRFSERGLSLYQPTAADRALLLGEAAGIDPVLGEGIPQAILYGRVGGDYLARCWRTEQWHFRDYRRVLRASRVGIDLRVRAAVLRLVYGRSRPFTERWVTRSRHLASAGMHYFAGRRVPRTKLVGMVADIARCLR